MPEQGSLGRQQAALDFSSPLDQKKQRFEDHLGAEFLVLFSSHSCSVTLKSSLKSHQMTTLFVQNVTVFTQMIIFFIQTPFLSQKFVIWWLYKDDLRARKREEKNNQKFRALTSNLVCQKYIYPESWWLCWASAFQCLEYLGCITLSVTGHHYKRKREWKSVFDEFYVPSWRCQNTNWP